jgi:hypothetical protein
MNHHGYLDVVAAATQRLSLLMFHDSQTVVVIL